MYSSILLTSSVYDNYVRTYIYHIYVYIYISYIYTYIICMIICNDLQIIDLFLLFSRILRKLQCFADLTARLGLIRYLFTCSVHPDDVHSWKLAHQWQILSFWLVFTGKEIFHFHFSVPEGTVSVFFCNPSIRNSSIVFRH